MAWHKFGSSRPVGKSIPQAGFWYLGMQSGELLMTKPSCEVDGSHQKYATLMENAWHALQVMLACNAHD